jgi:undecaprenyl-diphosphatase
VSSELLDPQSAIGGTGELGPWVERFDATCDGLFDRIRGHPVGDFVFTNASHLADFSLIWHAAALGTAIGVPSKTRQAIGLSVLLGLESLALNQGIKRLFRRTRPMAAGDPRFGMRTPSTSSFPSGHASSAAFAATLLTTIHGPRSAPLWFAIAAVIGTSRAYVRIHHASDVAAGAVAGLAMAAAARPVLRRLG